MLVVLSMERMKGFTGTLTFPITSKYNTLLKILQFTKLPHHSRKPQEKRHFSRVN